MNKVVALLYCFIFSGLMISCNPTTSVDEYCVICPFDFRLIDYEPDWSPDGSKIAYVHNDTTIRRYGINLMNSDGTGKRSWHLGGSNPTWSPDGQWIAFEQQGQIFKKNLTTDSLVQLTFNGRNFFPDWSPDGQWIAYNRSNEDETGPSGIWRMKQNGEEKESIFGGAFPDWQPNGEQLIGVIGTSSTSVWKRFKIYSISNGKNKILDAVINADNSFPKFSPDGSRIIFTSFGEGEKPQIWIIDVDGKNAKQLTTTSGYSSAWSPDGNWILFTKTSDLDGRLWRMKPDGSEKQPFTN